MRASSVLFAALALAGCSQNPVLRPEWPVTVAPAVAQPDRLVVLPPECGPAPATVTRLHGSAWHNPDLGLGCSQARNFVLQVEEPRDLLAGRPTGAPDAEREAAAISRYHKGEEKDLMRGSGTFLGQTGGSQ